MRAATAAEGPFPYPFHRTMEAVLRDEVEGCFCEMTELEGDMPGCPIFDEYSEEAA